MTDDQVKAAKGAALMLVIAIVLIGWSALGDSFCGNGMPSGDAALALCRRAEDNQGLLSVVAIVLAGVFFLLETKRANRAEAEVLRRAIEQEAKDRQAIIESRFAARQDRAVERARAMQEFHRSVWLPVHTLTREGRKLKDSLLTPHGSKRTASMLASKVAETRQAIALVIPAAPLDGKYRLSLHKLLAQLDMPPSGRGAAGAVQLADWLAELEHVMIGVENALTYMLEMTLYPHGLTIDGLDQ